MDRRWDIDISKIPAKGIGGLIFAIGTMVLFLVAIPAVRWFFLASIPLGLLVALGKYLWRRWRSRRDHG